MDEVSSDKKCLSQHLMRHGRVLRLQTFEWQVLSVYLDLLDSCQPHTPTAHLGNIS